jgi:ankyrin repeat protein
VKLLLDHKAAPDVQDREGLTPLHLAVEGLAHDVVAELLARKANVNVTDRKGRTPLAIAVEKMDAELAGLLRRHGARR